VHSRNPPTSRAMYTIVAPFALSAALLQQPTLPAPVRAAADRITGQQLMRDVEYLASDALRGRDTFSPGHDSAAAYIVARLRRAGLRSLDGGAFRQGYMVKEIAADTANTWVEIAGKRIPFGDDLLVQMFAGELSASAPVVYVGTGVNVPSLGIDSYKGVDVKGKIVLINAGVVPQGLSLSVIPADAEFGVRAAFARGALAVVSIASPRGVSRWASTRGALTAQQQELDPPVMSAFRAPELNWLILRPSAAAALFAGDSARGARVLNVGANAAAIPPSFELTAPMTVRVPQRSARLRPSYNVVAVLDGSDARLRSEYVTVAAHLDGAVAPFPVKGDSIYNAADDNASGSSVALAIAEQLARAPRPRRSVVFIWDSGEEVGLWGTRSFVGQQPVPLKERRSARERGHGGLDARARRHDAAGPDGLERGLHFGPAGAECGAGLGAEPRQSRQRQHAAQLQVRHDGERVLLSAHGRRPVHGAPHPGNRVLHGHARPVPRSGRRSAVPGPAQDGGGSANGARDHLDGGGLARAADGRQGMAGHGAALPLMRH